VGKGGNSRIKDDTDPVRIEVETALSKGIPIIPILVGSTNMPKPEQLPDSLKPFAFINAAPVATGRDFHRDLDRVIKTINTILKLPVNPAEKTGNSPKPRDESQGYRAQGEAAERKRLDEIKASTRRSFRRAGIVAAAASVLLAIAVVSPRLISQLKDATSNAPNQSVPKIANAVVKPPPSPPATGQVTSNDDILRNIVLASNDEPLSFTGVPNDSAFSFGFAKPTDLQVLNIFIRQDYSRELLFWLFTDTVNLKEGNRILGMRYDPPNDYGCDRHDPRHLCFGDYIIILFASGLTVEELTAQSTSDQSKDNGRAAGGILTIVYARLCFDPLLAVQAQNQLGKKWQDLSKLLIYPSLIQNVAAIGTR
jgi:hypothetical protein